MKINMEEEWWSRWKVEQSETIEFLRKYKWENLKKSIEGIKWKLLKKKKKKRMIGGDERLN